MFNFRTIETQLEKAKDFDERYFTGKKIIEDAK
jgi:hypothetical protein